MKMLITCLIVFSLVIVGLGMATQASASIQQAQLTMNPYGYYGYNSSCAGQPYMSHMYSEQPYMSQPCSGQPYMSQPCQGAYETQPCQGSYGMPQSQAPMEYCMRWVPGRWVPVTVMMPGRWVTRPVWVPGYPLTLYKPVPGYWQKTYPNGTPDLSVWRDSNNSWYATPYQQQQGQAGGYFDSNGVWQSSPQGVAPVPQGTAPIYEK